MKAKFLLTLFILINALTLNAELWLVEQDYVRLGKRVLYEEYKKKWLEQYQSYFGGKDLVSSTLAIQDRDASAYLYLTPIESYAGLDAREVLLKEFESSLKKTLMSKLCGTLNFTIASLQSYLPEASYIPEGMNVSFCTLPYVHFQIFSISPGNGELFEDHLKKLVYEEQMKKSNLCWRTWRVDFGGDIPKYAVCRFAKTRAALETDEIAFVHQRLKEVVRRYRTGEGVCRRDLSFIELPIASENRG